MQSIIDNVNEKDNKNKNNIKRFRNIYVYKFNDYFQNIIKSDIDLRFKNFKNY